MPTSLTAGRQVGHDQWSAPGVDRRRAVQAAITTSSDGSAAAPSGTWTLISLSARSQ